MRGVWSAAGTLACSGVGQDLESPITSPTDPPDIAGAYDAEWVAEGDCGGAAPPDFVTGPLDISGTPDALVLDFTEAVYDGWIDDTFTFAVSGVAEVGEWRIALAAEGLAYIEEDHWVLSGDLEMDTTGASDCGRPGTFVATELPE